jgi:hypothetical protein
LTEGRQRLTMCVLEVYRPTVAIGESLSRDWPRVGKLMRYAPQRALSRGVLALAASCCFACQPTVNIGQWTCPASTANASTTDAGPADAGGMTSADDPITLPWSTSFENRFCDFTPPSGFCTQPVQYTIVTSPVRSGHYAAAFTVVAADGGLQQSRCVRQGVLPTEAYYGAWYYIPTTATNSQLWNLFHFLSSDRQNGTWDVSLSDNTDGGPVDLLVLNFLWPNNPPAPHILSGPPVPIGSWFHLEFYFKRAKDATGETALYLDGTRVIDFPNVITDTGDSGQWYVGNLATGLAPPDSTLYVDDITIASTLGWTPPP